MCSFQAISRVKWLSGEKINISKSISVLVLRVLVWLWLGKTFCPVYTWPSPFMQQVFDQLGLVGGFSGHFAWISVMFEQQLCYKIPVLAQYEDSSCTKKEKQAIAQDCQR
jgi:hypothetical protein